MTRDRADLQRWYREAMLRRMDELRDLRERLEAGNRLACDEARMVGMSLRGSGSTFGFPEVTAVAALVETASDRDVLRRVEGLLESLRGVASGDAADAFEIPEWLARAAGVELGAISQSGVTDRASAWDTIARAGRLDHSGLASRVADHFGLEVTSLGERRRSAQRLVPEALAMKGRLVPLSEDMLTITVGTDDPTALEVELELERLTGRRPVFSVAPPAAIDMVLSELDSSDPSPAGSALPGSTHEAPGDQVSTGTTSAPPPSDPQVKSSASTAARAVEEEKTTILVVDDEPSARLIVRALLERRGYPVVEAEDGVAALELMRANEPVALVIADLNMPRMDGLELIWELRDAHDWEHLPVIVVTGEVDEILETQLMEEGADDYIRKPIDPRLFLARVESTIRRAHAG